MKREDKIFAIGISSLFISMLLVFLEAGKIFDSGKFHWLTAYINNLVILGIMFFLGISIVMFVKFLKLPH